MKWLDMQDVAIILKHHVNFMRQHGLRMWGMNFRQGLRNRADQLSGRWPI